MQLNTDNTAILLVEDDAGIGRVLTAGLEAHGFSVDWVRLGQAALERAAERKYAAVVLDRMLPDIDGLVICRSLRQAGKTTPVCMLTARDDVEDKLEGFDAGAQDYVTKPFEIRELVARLGIMIGRQRPQPDNTTLCVNGLTIDLLSRDVVVGNAQLDLTRREFDVLVYLAQHAGHVVSRDRILQNAWAGDGEVTPNTVDVYIGYLRRKISSVSDAPKITTARGIGFKLS